MIDGVTVVNIIEQTGDRGFDVFLHILGWSLLLIAVISLIAYLCTTSPKSLTYIFMTVVSALLVCFAIEANNYTPKRLQVTATEETSMIEFMEKYEIVSVDGSIYTVEERTESCD